MGLKVAPHVSRAQLGEFIAEAMGLYFPPERATDLERGLAGAAEELGFTDVNACADWLMRAPRAKTQLQVLVRHLTVGETYFFREKKTFDALFGSALPDLIRARRASGRRLRIWSAACCTGEECYSLAIFLRQVIPDLTDWQVTILGTDLNARFLQTATTGVYREWSFRDSPSWLKERYFCSTADGRQAILPEIKKQVTFAYLNLVEDVYPALATNTNAMDVIFCRNVLMYFTPAQAQKVVRNLRRALVDDGWLVVSPTDGSRSLFAGFTAINFPGVILYQKSSAKERSRAHGASEISGNPTAPWSDVPLSSSAPVVETPAPAPAATAAFLYQQGRHEEVSELLLSSLSSNDDPSSETLSLLTRALANQGKLAEALSWCERWLKADKMDPAAHYLRAVVCQELGDGREARQSLQRAIYLHPDFILAHFALGNLARLEGKNAEAARHFSLVSRLLAARPDTDPLPEADGLTAGQLAKIITSINTLEKTP